MIGFEIGNNKPNDTGKIHPMSTQFDIEPV